MPEAPDRAGDVPVVLAAASQWAKAAADAHARGCPHTLSGPITTTRRGGGWRMMLLRRRRGDKIDRDQALRNAQDVWSIAFSGVTHTATPSGAINQLTHTRTPTPRLPPTAMQILAHGQRRTHHHDDAVITRRIAILLTANVCKGQVNVHFLPLLHRRLLWQRRHGVRTPRR